MNPSPTPSESNPYAPPRAVPPPQSYTEPSAFLMQPLTGTPLLVVNDVQTEADAINAQKCYFRQRRSPFSRALRAIGLPLIMLLLAYDFLSDHNPRRSTPALGYTLLALCIYSVVLHPLLWRWQARRQFRLSSQKDRSVRLEIHDQGLRLLRDGIDISTRWEAFPLLVLSPAMILLFRTERYYLWLSRRSFTTEAEWESFLTIVRSRIPKVKVLT